MAEPDTCRDEIRYEGGVSAVFAGKDGAPTGFLFNRYGEISSQPYSGNLWAGVVKPATRPNRWFDYDGAVVLCGQFSKKPTGFFRALYAHVRLYIIDITAGIRPVHYGPGDEELSSGGLLFSTNTHPIPRISVGIDRWTAFPGLYGYLELKGGITHGWLGDKNEYVSKTLLHHKYIGGRIGGKLPVNISYEFHHAAQWGGHSVVHGDLGNDLRALWHVFSGQGGGTTRNEIQNAQGNHLFSQTLCLTAKGEGWHVDAYWQNINEDGPVKFIGMTMNVKDGLWGISAEQDRWPFISGLTFEVLQTTDQSGPWHDRDGMVFGGNDTYYWNSIYQQGWTYFDRTIGSPLLTPQDSRVWAYHGGVKGDIYGFRYRVTATYSDHYGTYRHPLRGHNTAMLIEVKKTVEQAWGLEFGLALAGDFGTQYGNRFGGMITVRKQGIIKQW
jgi:hypothetical protein